jgi:hypothetical protein
MPLRQSRRKKKAKAKSTERPKHKVVLDNAHQQTQSPFLQRLPAELRLLIYAFVFENQIAQILTDDGSASVRKLPAPSSLPKQSNMAALPCKAMSQKLPCSSATECHSTHYSTWNKSNTQHLCCLCQPMGLGGLLRTCRLLYAEAMSPLYSKTSFIFDSITAFRKFYDNISANQQFTCSPLTFVQDIRFGFPWPEFYIPDEMDALHSGLALLAEQAVNLKRLDINFRPKFYWTPENKLLSRKALRLLNRFRGLEKFNIFLSLAKWFRDPVYVKERASIEKIVRELVCQPRGSSIMTSRQFKSHFETRYWTLMA